MVTVGAPPRVTTMAVGVSGDPRGAGWKNRVMPDDQTPCDPEATGLSRSMLLGPTDLGGDPWGITEERSWPTGGLDSDSDKSRRALQAGLVTVWRLMTRTGPERSLPSVWVEVVPYASAADAALSLRQVPRFFVGGGRPDVTVRSERTVADRAVPGVADPWVFESSTSGPEGDTESRYVGGTVERVLFLVCLSAQTEPWSWEDVTGVATRQAERVRLILDRG